MQQAGVERVAFDTYAGSSELPFLLGRQPCARPARVGIGLVVADVTDRGMLVNRAPAGQREFLLQRFRPVERPVPAFTHDCCPAIRQPELGLRICTVVDEVSIFGVCDQPVADRVLVDNHRVPWRLVVETETVRARTDVELAARS